MCVSAACLPLSLTAWYTSMSIQSCMRTTSASPTASSTAGLHDQNCPVYGAVRALAVPALYLAYRTSLAGVSTGQRSVRLTNACEPGPTSRSPLVVGCRTDVSALDTSMRSCEDARMHLQITWPSWKPNLGERSTATIRWLAYECAAHIDDSLPASESGYPPSRPNSSSDGAGSSRSSEPTDSPRWSVPLPSRAGSTAVYGGGCAPRPLHRACPPRAAAAHMPSC